MQVGLTDIRKVLSDYRKRYRWLDVFPSDVREIVENVPIFETLPENVYRVDVGGDRLEMRYYPATGIVRFSLVDSAVPLAAVGGAALGAVSAKKPRDLENAILGLLIGGLMGAAIDNASKEPDESRIMTLVFEHRTSSWRVYGGPYVSWAKSALNPAAG